VIAGHVAYRRLECRVPRGGIAQLLGMRGAIADDIAAMSSVTGPACPH
jgi:hypothetical protein